MTHPQNLEVLTRATDKGDGEFNEDSHGWNRRRAWVIDGGTDVKETVRPERSKSGAWWISDLLNSTLQMASFDTPLPDVLSDFAFTVRSVVSGLSTSREAVSPVCSVGIIERQGANIRIYSVGDVEVYLPRLNFSQIDPRFGSNEKRGVGLDSDSGKSTILDRRRKYLRGEGGAWVLGDNPLVKYGVSETVLDCPDPCEAVLASDGFARAVEPYGLFAHRQSLAEACLRLGAGSVISSIRRHEEGSPNEPTHYKKRDDTTALAVRI